MVYYRKTGQRVRVAFDAAVIGEAEALIAAGVGGGAERARFRSRWWIRRSVRDARWWESACRMRRGSCSDRNWRRNRSNSGCSRRSRRKPVKREVRPLVTPRSELRPLYLNSQGMRVGKSGAVLQVKDKEKVVQEVRLGEICQVSLMGNVQISTQAVQALCESGVPICYFSMGGWFYGITTGMNQKNVFLRRSQFRLSDAGVFRAGAGAAVGGGEDPQSEDAVAAESRGAETGDAGGDEGDGGPGGGSGVAGGIAGDRGQRGAAVFRGFRGDDQAGRGSGRGGAARSISMGATGGRRGIR